MTTRRPQRSCWPRHAFVRGGSCCSSAHAADRRRPPSRDPAVRRRSTADRTSGRRGLRRGYPHAARRGAARRGAAAAATATATATRGASGHLRHARRTVGGDLGARRHDVGPVRQASETAEWAGDPGYAYEAGRRLKRNEITGRLTALCAGSRAIDVVERLRAAAIPAAVATRCIRGRTRPAAMSSRITSRLRKICFGRREDDNSRISSLRPTLLTRIRAAQPRPRASV